MIRDFTLNSVYVLLFATRWTILLALVGISIGGIGGLAVALMRNSRWLILRSSMVAFIELVQSTPVLMLLFLSYFGLSILGVHLDPFFAASLAMSVYAAAYFGNIWFGTIRSINPAQWEASASLALTRSQQYRYVILPQCVRLALPATIGFCVQVIKDTSVASLIGFIELTRAAQLLNNATFQPFQVFVSAAVIYFVICFPLSCLGQYLEKKTYAGN